MGRGRGRGRFEAEFARWERWAVIGRRLASFVGALRHPARVWAGQQADAEPAATNQDWRSKAKKEADPRPRS